MKINKIHNIDAIDGLKCLADDSADCIILDPPYNIGKDFGNNKTKQDIRQYVSWSKQWIEQSKRVLKPSGTMFIYGFSEILAHLSVNLDMEHRWLVWHYTNKTVPSLNFWQRSHESVLCAWHDKSQRIFNRDAVREPYTDKFIQGYKDKGRKRPQTKGRFSSDKEETVYKVNDKGALPRDVLKHSTLAGGSGRKERVFYCRKHGQAYHPKEMKNHKNCKTADGQSAILKHPTQKPIELTNRLISSCMPEKGLVVVPFVGSGSEIHVSKKLGHDYVGFEINEDYFKLINFFINNDLEAK